MASERTVAPVTPDPGIDIDYVARFPRSRSLYERARTVFPAGITHDTRRSEPFPIYMSHGAGSRLWDVDGNQYVDWAMGHGALILGHSHPEIVRAVTSQISRLTHGSAGHELEIEWAGKIQRVIPSAERVRFVMSGTEATMLAMRIARGFTGRPVVVRIEGHFHGWHDYAAFGSVPPFDVPATAGIPSVIGQTVRTIPADDLDSVESAIRQGDVAAMILEPEGAAVPVGTSYLEGIRELTKRHGVVLIFDEVVSGFRMAPGGAQAYYGVRPDLTALGKIVSGGLPGGAVAGSADIFETMEFRADPEWNRYDRVWHFGTWNGNPISAAAGCAALDLLQDGTIQDQAANVAGQVRAGLNAVLRDLGIGGCAYGERSTFWLIVGDDLPRAENSDVLVSAVTRRRLREGTRPTLRNALNKALLLEGISVMGGNHGWASVAHTPDDVAQTVKGFASALARAATMKARTSSPLEHR